jgi:hypothetical protein
MVKYIFSSRPDNTLKHLSYDPIGPEWLNELGSWIKRCTRLTAASDKVYHGLQDVIGNILNELLLIFSTSVPI